MMREVRRAPWGARLILVSAGLALVAAPALARRGDETRQVVEDKRITFAGIAWFSPADSVRAQLARRGFHIVPETREAVVAQGRSFERPTVVHAVLDDSLRVVRWEITLLSEAEKSIAGVAPDPADEPFTQMKRVYDDVVSECTSRYGRPLDDVESYEFPYDKGDGRGMEALHDHKATIRSTWHARRSGDRLLVEMDPDVNVVLTYTSTAWSGFQTRQRHRKGRDL